jgi:hypothetical protein
LKGVHHCFGLFGCPGGQLDSSGSKDQPLVSLRACE